MKVFDNFLRVIEVPAVNIIPIVITVLICPLTFILQLSMSYAGVYNIVKFPFVGVVQYDRLRWW